MSRWICIKGCRALNQNFKEGKIFDHPTNPSSGNFEEYSGDEILLLTKGARTDRDGTYYFPKPGWDDLRFPATQTIRGALNKPDFDYTNIGLLFPQDDADEIIYIIAQLPHDLDLKAGLRPHLHYVQDEVEDPVFKMDYRVVNNGGDPAGAFTTLTAVNKMATYVSGSLLQIVDFPPIDLEAAGITGVSAIMEIKIYRDDNVVSGDVLVKEFDMHYRRDSPGSGKEYYK